MTEEKYITASCTITNNKVIKNGVRVFEDAGTPINDFLAAVYKYALVQYPKFYKMDNISKLGWLAADILLNDFDKNKYPAEEVAIILTNANASLDSDIKYMESVKEIASPALFVYTLPNIVIGEICIRNKFKGENAFYITQQFDAALVHRQVSTIMQRSTACICGWVDVLGSEYKAALFLVEHEETNALPFTADNLNRLFEKS